MEEQTAWFYTKVPLLFPQEKEMEDEVMECDATMLNRNTKASIKNKI